MEQTLITLTMNENTIEDDPRIDSRLVAKGLGIQHESFIKTLNTYEKELAEFGQLRFETEVGYRKQGGGNPTQFVMLNENQIIFAVTLSRNTPRVVQFKLAAVKAFSLAREIIHTLKVCPTADLENLSFHQVRLVGLVGEMIDLDNKGESYTHLIPDVHKEAQEIPSGIPWGSSAQPVKLLK